MQLTMSEPEVRQLPGADIVLALTGDNRDEWLEARRLGVGGSDASGIMGLSKYSSPMIVAMDKLGFAPQTPENTAIRFGNALEPFLRDRVPEEVLARFGAHVQSIEHPYLLRSTEHPFMQATLDGLVIPPADGFAADIDGAPLEITGDEPMVLEIKTGGEFQMEHWTDDEVPDAYYTQVQHNMVVAGVHMAVVYALIGREFILRFVPRNEQFCADLIERERTFWDEYVAQSRIPDPIGIEKEDDYLLDSYPSIEREAVVDLSDHAPLAEEYVQIHEQVKALTQRKKEIAQLFKARIGEAKIAEAGDHKITWTRFDQTDFDRKRFEEEHPKLFQQYVRPVRRQRLMVK